MNIQGTVGDVPKVLQAGVIDRGVTEGGMEDAGEANRLASGREAFVQKTVAKSCAAAILSAAMPRFSGASSHGAAQDWVRFLERL